MEELKDVADHITDFYSFSGKKLIPHLRLISRVFNRNPIQEYFKPTTPNYFKVNT